LAAGRARVVDEDVHAAKRVLRAPRQHLHLCRIGYVAGDGGRPPAKAADLTRQRLQLRAAACANCHIRPFARQCQRDGAPDAAAGPRDDGALAR